MIRRPFSVGLAAGLLLPVLVVMAATLTGRMDDYLQQSRGYAMLPLFAPLGVLAFLLAWKLFDRLQVPRMGAAFSLGLLLGGSLFGSVVLWVSSAERPPVNRAVFSVFGGPLLIGFWLWIGAVIGYAWRQQSALRAST